jgi:hypothetical protein
VTEKRFPCCHCKRMIRSVEFYGAPVWFGADDIGDTFCEANPERWHEPYPTRRDND